MTRTEMIAAIADRTGSGRSGRSAASGRRQRALQEFLPKAAVDPDRVSGIDDIMADAVTYKYISAPLSKEQLDDLVQIPERRR